MRIVLLGFTISDERMAEILQTDAHMPTQTHSFAWSVVRALRAAGLSVSLLSSEPLTSYPGNPSVAVRGSAFVANGVEGRTLGFVNLLLAKHITRFWSCLTSGTRFLRRKRPDVVLVHGVHSPYLLYGVLARRLLSTPFVVILTDPPGVVLPDDSRLVRALKRLDIAVVRGLLARLDGVVALTAALAEHYAPSLPPLVLEGIVDDLPEEEPPADSISEQQPHVVMYAGGLSGPYGAGLLLDAVRRLDHPDVVLRTLGRGELAEAIDAAAQTDRRVEPTRFATRQEVLAEYRRASVLVQPRPVDQDFVRYSFPSKLMEYLASGTPVISTRLPGIPAEYGDHLHWADDTADGLANAIEEVLDLTADERRRRGAAARDFVWRTRGYAAQGRRLRDFLRQVAHAHRP